MLDHLKIPSREEARRLAIAFKAELLSIVLQGHSHKHEGEIASHLGCSLVSAFEKGQL
jgi:unspecific monooxygenase